ncbi:MBL fold metallo-hydrolase [Nocardia otitidiscaviarum]|uniref:MBL fold metallo-hydrolase n=1 Tax=Nocardia otitidiscaviarum TaxID=1823 RepID=UPI0004A7304A|nr:MBL fold metallo-hydrolase [Nocardia otitidiscaviarum]MBF6136214.1 MBL fold metallo-hydrolase [Nocardia otitidiscaviarum]MBF6179074.1 MBL fold metallo-hydrolase [Nocardia otitidiscaviarum]MBF6238264.1 MBL fold metallo-hydrolase [Nocardia otitidiscaviarum]MBF6483996.1 MBL fold metallo-hydrolase [Nocardia otitidiscaviarum]
MTLNHPAYERVRQVTPSAAVLLADNPGQMTLEGTNTWLLRAPQASGWVVVDPGPKDRAHSEAIARATDGDIALTLITHHHHDHTGGIDRLVRLTGTPVRAVDSGFLHGGGTELVDGEVIEAAGVRLTAVATPGHTADSVSLLLDGPDDADAAVLTGDTVLGSGTTVLESRDDALADYLASLRRLAEIAPGRTLLPAHGPDHLDAEPVIGYYLKHREERLQQVRDALEKLGPKAKPLQIVAHVYADVDKRLWPAAHSSVKAQLAYIRSHG